MAVRDAQVEAIKTYLFLKIACGTQPLATLFSRGAFNNLNLDEAELSAKVRDYLKGNSAAAALYEYATLRNDRGEQVSEKLEKQIKTAPESIDYHQFFRDAFYKLSYGYPSPQSEQSLRENPQAVIRLRVYRTSFLP